MKQFVEIPVRGENHLFNVNHVVCVVPGSRGNNAIIVLTRYLNESCVVETDLSYNDLIRLIFE